ARSPRGPRSPRPPSAARPPFDGNVSGAPTPRRYHGHAMLRRIDVRGRGLADIEIPRPRVAEEPPVAAVRDIIASVRAGGDGALRALTARLDGATIEALRVPPEACEAALAALPAALRAAMEEAKANIEAYHRAQLHDAAEFVRGGARVREVRRAVARAGCYVPRDLLSTVLMTAVPA